jgi:uncharacterized protein YdeI (YjbR/CyaY-like superfamily)
MSTQETKTFTPKSQADWRKWLQENHDKEQNIWLIYYKKSSSKHNLEWSHAVDEALCFGWIDSTRKSLDDERFMQYFGRRKPNSTWSKVNKDKVEVLRAEGKMTRAGEKCIEIAQENGSWTFLDSIDALIVPDDLQEALLKNQALEFYENQKKAIKRGLLYWVKTAKREDTRNKRIMEIADLASQSKLPKQFK